MRDPPRPRRAALRARRGEPQLVADGEPRGDRDGHRSLGQPDGAGRLADAEAGQGLVEILVEICDPSGGAQWGYTVNGYLISDFVTPNYYDPVGAPGVRYSFTGVVTRPREVLEGGYLSWRDPATGEWWQAERIRQPELAFRRLGPARRGRPADPGADRPDDSLMTQLYTGISRAATRPCGTPTCAASAPGRRRRRGRRRSARAWRTSASADALDQVDGGGNSFDGLPPQGPDAEAHEDGQEQGAPDARGRCSAGSTAAAAGRPGRPRRRPGAGGRA